MAAGACGTNHFPCHCVAGKAHISFFSQLVTQELESLGIAFTHNPFSICVVQHFNYLPWVGIICKVACISGVVVVGCFAADSVFEILQSVIVCCIILYGLCHPCIGCSICCSPGCVHITAYSVYVPILCVNLGNLEGYYRAYKLNLGCHNVAVSILVAVHACAVAHAVAGCLVQPVAVQRMVVEQCGHNFAKVKLGFEFCLDFCPGGCIHNIQPSFSSCVQYFKFCKGAEIFFSKNCAAAVFSHGCNFGPQIFINLLFCSVQLVISCSAQGLHTHCLLICIAFQHIKVGWQIFCHRAVQYNLLCQNNLLRFRLCGFFHSFGNFLCGLFHRLWFFPWFVHRRCFFLWHFIRRVCGFFSLNFFNNRYCFCAFFSMNICCKSLYRQHIHYHHKGQKQCGQSFHASLLFAGAIPHYILIIIIIFLLYIFVN